jgi:hypothetical protein
MFIVLIYNIDLFVDCFYCFYIETLDDIFRSEIHNILFLEKKLWYNYGKSN